MYGEYVVRYSCRAWSASLYVMRTPGTTSMCSRGGARGSIRGGSSADVGFSKVGRSARGASLDCVWVYSPSGLLAARLLVGCGVSGVGVDPAVAFAAVRGETMPSIFISSWCTRLGINKMLELGCRAQEPTLLSYLELRYGIDLYWIWPEAPRLLLYAPAGIKMRGVIRLRFPRHACSDALANS